MTTVKNTGIPVMRVDEIVELLGKSYSRIISNKLPLRTFPSVMLWGPPGVGKSQAVRQIGNTIHKNADKKVVVTDVRLLLFNPVDLRGIPTSNKDKTLAVWLKPKIFQMDPSDEVVNILFLDEISAAPQTVQAAAYQITLDRTVGEHSLPENCIVIAAGNRTTDKAVAFKMPSALANRLMHIEVEDNFESWKKWAVMSGIHPFVIGFLSFRQTMLMTFDPSQSYELAFATPRSWEMVSNILNYVSDDVEEVYDLIAGVVGIGTAVEFRTWSSLYKDLPSIDDIFKGENPEVPQRIDTLYALVSSMVQYARQHKNELDLISNSIEYAERMPADFSVVLMTDYMYLEDGYKTRLLNLPSFKKWLKDKGRFINGII